MAKVNDGVLRDWSNGDIMDSPSYEQDREILRVAINDNADQLTGLKATTGAGEVGATAITGTTGANVQDILASLKGLIDGNQTNITTLFSTNGATSVGVLPISGITGNNVQIVLQNLLTQINTSANNLSVAFSLTSDLYLDGGNFLDTYSSNITDIDGGAF